MKLTPNPMIASICLASILSVESTTALEAAIIDIAAFGAKADGSDTTPSVRAALDEARRSKATKLTFSPGRYDFWPEIASEQYLLISNNDEGLKRVIFPLTDMEGLEIDGGGASFIFHGPIRGNRARGILLGSRGKMVIEGNTFHTPGAAILFEGDARFWFEQAGVRDVAIRGNIRLRGDRNLAPT